MNALRTIPASFLATASAVLGGAARLAEYGARRLAPPSEPEKTYSAPQPGYSPPPPASPVEDEMVEPAVAGEVIVEEEVAVEPLPSEPDDTGVIADEPSPDGSAIDAAGGQVRTYESHIAELADQNVSAVVRGIQDLSTEELGQLFDYESAHRKRKTVLQAIERAAAPTVAEDVFTTESPEYRDGDPPL